MLCYDPVYEGKAHPSSFKLALFMQPLKDAKQLVAICHIKAYAVILDGKYDKSVFL